MLPKQGESPPTPQSLPLRERVLLAQRIAIARATKVPWAEIAHAEQMKERTLRHFHRMWMDDLDREREDKVVLLHAVQRAFQERARARNAGSAS